MTAKILLILVFLSHIVIYVVTIPHTSSEILLFGILTLMFIGFNGIIDAIEKNK